MRISELARITAIPVPTIKYYLREGILQQGESRGATQADYGDEHVQRLRLIRSLADVAGLPIARIKTVLDLIDHPGDDLFDALGRAIASLPPYATDSDDAEHPRAKAAIERLDWTYDADFAATAQLDRALQAVSDAGIPLTDERLETYGAALHRLAEFDVAQMPSGSRASGTDADADANAGREAGSAGGGRADTEEDALGQASAAIEYAVLGTALYEPVVVAMRRLAHQDVAARMLHPPATS
ncbi:MerR family transcriptional regulator [Planctomonas sp. JC2975]|uniref:MerR family transcriptional regulator n=1 Tax=Planctomonas sp. JC2975 TaxID=2729626 RepID=UPI0014736B3E|nr:MerR family transcriptional regulator [Planctomonas sp. JC2975]NNC12939.1 MerR family transcriptional regulator [Planctomonas sp. JC2975]